MIGRLVTAAAVLVPVLAPGADPATTYPNARCLRLVPPAYGQQVWDGTGPDNLLALKIPAWVRRHQASRFAFTVYSTTGSQMPNALRLIRSDHGSHAYVTDGNPATGNPYNTVPRYWHQEVADVKASCR